MDYSANKPTGSDAESVFHQETWEQTRGERNRLRSTSTVWFEFTPRGIFAHARPGGKTTPAKPSDIDFYTMQASNLPANGNPAFRDYIVCSDKSGVLHPIAKPPELRGVITQELREGTLYSYAYPGTGGLLWSRRTDLNDGLFQGITPPYVPDDIAGNPSQKGSLILACTPSGGTGVVIEAADTTLYGNPGKAMPAGSPVTLQDMNVDGRAWSVLPNQSGVGS